MTKEIKEFLGRLKHELETAKDNCDDAKPSERSYLYGLWRGIYLLTNNLEYKALVDKDDKPDVDGWITWEGEERPVDDVLVEVKTRYVTTIGKAGSYRWNNNIVAFRIIEEPDADRGLEKMLREAKDEIDMEFPFGLPPIEEKQTFNEFIYDKYPAIEDTNTLDKLTNAISDYLEKKDIPVRKVPRH